MYRCKMFCVFESECDLKFLIIGRNYNNSNILVWFVKQK